MIGPNVDPSLMKNPQPLFLYLIIAALAVSCGTFALHSHRLEQRVAHLEHQIAHIFDPKAIKIAVAQ